MINIFQNHRENMYYAINDAGTTNFFGGKRCVFTLSIYYGKTNKKYRLNISKYKIKP